MKTLYISDLDGTLLNSKAELSENSKNIINALTRKGVCFTVATARTYATARFILDGLELNVPAVLMNGVCTFDFDKKEYTSCRYIGGESVDRFVSTVGRDGAVSPFIFTIKDNQLSAYHNNLNSRFGRSFMEERREKYNKRFFGLPDWQGIDKEHAVYFTVFDELHRLEGHYKTLSEDKNLYIAFYRDTYSNGTYYLECCSKLASKAGGIRYLKKQFGFDRVVCFGDNTNDLPMFSESDEIYVPSNAHDEIKAYATAIIPSNDEDGVAKKLMELEGL